MRQSNKLSKSTKTLGYNAEKLKIKALENKLMRFTPGAGEIFGYTANFQGRFESPKLFQIVIFFLILVNKLSKNYKTIETL